MRPIGISAVILLATCVLWFSLAPLRGLFWLHPGDFGVVTDSSLRVTDIDSPGPAYGAGIRVGDRFDTTTSFEKRLDPESVRNPAPGQRVTLQVKRQDGPFRAVKIVAGKMALDSGDIATYFTWPIVDLVFVVVGSIIVCWRRSKMTWASSCTVSGLPPASCWDITGCLRGWFSLAECSSAPCKHSVLLPS